MTLPKPYETEHDRLGPAPGPPEAPEHARRIAVLVALADEGRIRIGDRELRLPNGSDPPNEVARLRARLARRARRRRPHADEHTWAELRALVHGEVRDRTRFDEDLERALVIAIDGL